ncbi:MAG: restriction endonuclease [Candidatus Ozemobacteraceae bacterium]
MNSTCQIDLNKLTSRQFEEFCFDLLMELGFQKLVWRQGGADSGRDIQGTRSVSTGLIDPFEETWFFECKRYSEGVPPEVLNSKIAWADAEQPKHFVLFVSSYVTTPARTWLAMIASKKPYHIHLIEGKQLQHLVGRSHALVARFFSSEIQLLMQQTQRAWVVHNLLPEPKLLRTLAEPENVADYTPSQLAFLWSAIKIRFEELNADMADSYSESYDILFGLLKGHSNTQDPVVRKGESWSVIDIREGINEKDIVYPKIWAVEAAHIVNNVEYIAIYSLVRDSDGEGLEVLVDQNSSFTFKIRHISSSAGKVLSQAKHVFGIEH